MTILLLGIAFLGWRASSYSQPLMNVAGFTWMALFYLCCLLCAVLFTDSVLSGCLRWGWLRGLGMIAYGTYLFHELFAGIVFGRFPWIYSIRDLSRSLLTLVVTLTFCRLSWVYFEKPLVKLGHRSRYEFAATQPPPEPTVSPLASVPK